MVEGHYKQFDDVVDLYNEKFAKPIAAIMDELKEQGYITAAPFDEKIEWTWWEIWHHEGRRARHGASMNGPDYTWWHGIYDVAKNTYFECIRHHRGGPVVEGEATDEAAVDAVLPTPDPAPLPGQRPPQSDRVLIAGADERQGAALRPPGGGCRAVQGGAQVARQGWTGAHRVHARLRPRRARHGGDVARGEDVFVGGGAQVRVHQDETAVVAGQTGGARPFRRAAAGGPDDEIGAHGRAFRKQQ